MGSCCDCSNASAMASRTPKHIPKCSARMIFMSKLLFVTSDLFRESQDGMCCSPARWDQNRRGADIPVRGGVRRKHGLGLFGSCSLVGGCCGQECPRSVGEEHVRNKLCNTKCQTLIFLFRSISWCNFLASF